MTAARKKGGRPKLTSSAKKDAQRVEFNLSKEARDTIAQFRDILANYYGPTFNVGNVTVIELFARYFRQLHEEGRFTPAMFFPPDELDREIERLRELKRERDGADTIESNGEAGG